MFGESSPVSKYHVTGSLSLAVEPSLLQARWSGTLYRTVSETRQHQQQQLQATTEDGLLQLLLSILSAV